MIADGEHPEGCGTGRASEGGGGGGGSGGSGGGGGEGGGLFAGRRQCGSCHWAISAPPALWSACSPMGMEVSVAAIEHSELPGTAGHECAATHYALLAQRSSSRHELQARYLVITPRAPWAGGSLPSYNP